jgi:hypothetical protein
MTHPDAYHDALRALLARYEADQHAAEETGDLDGAELAERRRWRLSGLLSNLTSRRNAIEAQRRNAEDDRHGYRD